MNTIDEARKILVGCLFILRDKIVAANSLPWSSC